MVGYKGCEVEPGTGVEAAEEAGPGLHPFEPAFVISVFTLHPSVLWVPKISSTSSDQAIFVDQATDASLPSDAVLLKVDRFG